MLKSVIIVLKECAVMGGLSGRRGNLRKTAFVGKMRKGSEANGSKKKNTVERTVCGHI